MEKSYYLKETLGPGAYLPLDQIYDTSKRNSQKFSVPKTNRNLLSKSV